MTTTTQRLSEMILLGDTIRKRDHTTYLRGSHSSGWCGCAQGGAQLALGRTDLFAFLQLWPWLHDDDPNSPGMQYWQAINYKFAEVQAGKLTFEQLVEWVASVEPKQQQLVGDSLVAEMEQMQLDMATGG